MKTDTHVLMRCKKEKSAKKQMAHHSCIKVSSYDPQGRLHKKLDPSFFFFVPPRPHFVNCCRWCVKDLRFQAHTGHLLRKECSLRSPPPLTGGLVGPDFQPHSPEFCGSEPPRQSPLCQGSPIRQLVLCSLIHTYLKNSD